jgi:hypothetical protein
MTGRDREFAEAARVVEDSLIVRGVVRGAAAIETAVAGSRVAGILKKIRVTQIGVLITSGCVTHALLLQLMPDRVAPVKPLAYGMVLAFAAFATAAGRITTRSRATAAAESSAGTANAMKS